MTKEEAKAILIASDSDGPMADLLRDLDNAQDAAAELRPDAPALDVYICALVVELHVLRNRVAELEKRNV